MEGTYLVVSFPHDVDATIRIALEGNSLAIRQNGLRHASVKIVPVDANQAVQFRAASEQMSDRIVVEERERVGR